jgi:hypothetical protein
MEFKIVSRKRQPEPPHATLTARPSTIWEPDSVGKRLVQAFVTLDRLPRLRGPREPGGHWPGTITGWADQVAQAELEQSERQAAANFQSRHNSPNGRGNRADGSRIRMVAGTPRRRRLHGRRDNSLGAADCSQAINQSPLHRKTMAAAYFLSKKGQGPRQHCPDA